jgi:hypothetical protein
LQEITFLLSQMTPVRRYASDDPRQRPPPEPSSPLVRYANAMNQAVSVGLRNHPLIHEFVTVHQSFGWKFEVRENLGKTRRRLKREAQRPWTQEERQLYFEIWRYIADTRYKSWDSIFYDLLACKDKHPWGIFLKGTTRESFRKLRNRLGFTESKPRNYRR